MITEAVVLIVMMKMMMVEVEMARVALCNRMLAMEAVLKRMMATVVALK